MTFDLLAIFIFGAAALVYGLLPVRGRGWLLLAGSVIAIYWLQPALPIRFSDTILPTATIGLTVAIWWFTRWPDDEAQPAMIGEDRVTLALIAALVLGMSLMRFVPMDYRLTASRPPNPLLVVLGLVGVGTAVSLIHRLTRHRNQWQVMAAGILFVTGLFVLLKSEGLATAVSHGWRGQTGQDVSLANAIDLNWLGFSYVAFRLIHTLRDRQTGLLPTLSLREYVTYVIFFPAFTAGPIDRAERFVADFRALPQMVGLDAARFSQGWRRIMLGLLKKFVIADSLAQGVSLNGVNVTQVNSAGGLWLLLYGYGLRLLFDFSGYSDIAIGIGILFGIRLPENFNRPYLKTNITAFWQSWHISLSDWARFYVFSPLSRSLLRRKPRPSPALIVLSAQMATMVVIGLWHGISLNFLVWGLWHGVGLWLHRQWSDRTRQWYRGLSGKRGQTHRKDAKGAKEINKGKILAPLRLNFPIPGRMWVWTAVSWLITFHYVVVGWVWFVLPDVGQAARTVGRLFGVGW